MAKLPYPAWWCLRCADLRAPVPRSVPIPTPGPRRCGLSQLLPASVPRHLAPRMPPSCRRPARGERALTSPGRGPVPPTMRAHQRGKDKYPLPLTQLMRFDPWMGWCIAVTASAPQRGHIRVGSVLPGCARLVSSRRGGCALVAGWRRRRCHVSRLSHSHGLSILLLSISSALGNLCIVLKLNGMGVVCLGEEVSCLRFVLRCF
jgi:hypothetical protein